MVSLGNIADLVRRTAERDGAHTAFVDTADGRVITWSEFDAVIDAESIRLSAAGVRPGDRVVVRLPTSLSFCVAVFAVFRLGAVLVPIAPSVSVEELDRIVADSEARTVIDSVSAVGSKGTADRRDSVGGGEDLAILAYTSSTSGAPRGVMLSHRALLANVEQFAALRPAPVTASDRVLLALPLFHAYGLGPGLLQVARAGATGILLRDFDAEKLLRAVEEHRVNTVIGVPPMYSALLRTDHEVLRERLKTVRLFTSGAAPLDSAILQGMREVTGLDVFEGYGATEAGPVLTSTLGSGRPAAGSVGPAVPGVELRLVDVDGIALPEGAEMGEDAESTGLVAARGPNLFSGYWPDGAGGPDADGWFRTGDVGYFDADGDLHLVDRAGDLIVVNGFNVYPHEIETVLAGLEGVAEVAAVGVPDEHSGETVKVVIVPELAAGRPGPTEQSVIEYCEQRLAKFKVPTKVEFATALPHTPTGKLLRPALRTP